MNTTLSNFELNTKKKKNMLNYFKIKGEFHFKLVLP